MDGIVLIESWGKKGQALNMVPMKVRKENVTIRGVFRGCDFQPQLAYARPRVEYDTMLGIDGKFYAGSIPTYCIEQIFGQGREKFLSG